MVKCSCSFIVVFFIAFISCHKSDDKVRCLHCDVTTFPFPNLPYDTTAIDGVFIISKGWPNKQSAFARQYYSNLGFVPEKYLIRRNYAPLQYRADDNYYSHNREGTFFNDTSFNWRVQDSIGQVFMNYDDTSAQPIFTILNTPDSVNLSKGLYIHIAGLKYADTILATVFDCNMAIPNYYRKPTYSYYNTLSDSIFIEHSAFLGVGGRSLINNSVSVHTTKVISGNTYLSVKQYDIRIPVQLY